MMAFENLLYETRNGIGYVTINRPEKLNALNLKTMEEIYECFRRIEKDDAVRTVILTGAGEKAFVGGQTSTNWRSKRPWKARSYPATVKRFWTLSST